MKRTSESTSVTLWRKLAYCFNSYLLNTTAYPSQPTCEETEKNEMEDKRGKLI